MKRVIRIALMALVALAVMVPAHAASTITVGDFLTQIAFAKNVPATDAAAAAAGLRAGGVNLPALELNAPLTEGAVAQVARSLGLTVTTNNPRAPFTQAQAYAFVSAFGPVLKVPKPGVRPMGDDGQIGNGEHNQNGFQGQNEERSNSEPI